MKQEMKEKLEKHIDKILNKKTLKAEDISLLTIMIMAIANPVFEDELKEGGK